MKTMSIYGSSEPVQQEVLTIGDVDILLLLGDLGAASSSSQR